MHSKPQSDRSLESSNKQSLRMVKLSKVPNSARINKIQSYKPDNCSWQIIHAPSFSLWGRHLGHEQEENRQEFDFEPHREEFHLPPGQLRTTSK